MSNIINPATVKYEHFDLNDFTLKLCLPQYETRLPFVTLRDGTTLSVYEDSWRGFKTNYQFFTHISWSRSGHAFDCNGEERPELDMVSMQVPECNDHE